MEPDRNGSPAPGAAPPAPPDAPAAPRDAARGWPDLALVVVAATLLGILLGTRLLWTHEQRWAAICTEMLRTGDYLHPNLVGEAYYDKPLLTYWLMIGFARLLGGLSEWALRLPSALAALVAVVCTVRLGRALFDRAAGLWAGGILATCVFFVFWGRVASADMLNLAGIVGAAAWYFERRDRPGFVTYAVFFLILAVTALMKGLIGVVIPLLILSPDLLAGGRWKTHLRPSLALAGLPALAVYLVPFLVAKAAGGDGGEQGGLMAVFRENVVRYFAPFDHMSEPFYVYGGYVPVYFLPWSLFLPPAVWAAARGWRGMDGRARWPAWACLLIFLFLSASLSRRSYYVLPILPFAALLVAGWLRGLAPGPGRRRWRAAAGAVAAVSAAGLAAWFGVIQPHVESHRGIRAMGAAVRAELERRAPLAEWNVVLWGTPEGVGFYLAPGARAVGLDPNQEEAVRAQLRERPRTMVVTKAENEGAARAMFARSVAIREPPSPPVLNRFPVTRSRPLVAVIPDP